MEAVEFFEHINFHSTDFDNDEIDYIEDCLVISHIKIYRNVLSVQIR